MVAPYLHGGEHVRQAKLHEEVSAGGVRGGQHGQVHGGDGVRERAHGQLGLEPPGLLAAVGHRVVVTVPHQPHLLLLLPVKRQRKFE